MTQKELINQIKEARKEFLDKNPCKHCVGSGCDDCRDCEDAPLRHELSLKVFKLKEEFEKLYNIEYDDYINNQKSQSQNYLNKELLLKDLSARLPYGVKVKFTIDENIERNDNIIYVIDGEHSYVCNKKTIITYDNIKYVYNGFFDDVKPYLFPLSSMTEEQQKEENQIKQSYDYDEESFMLFDWYNKNHFDYRGLISKGLALDATGLNIY